MMGLWSKLTSAFAQRAGAFDFILSAYYPKFDPDKVFMIECFIALDQYMHGLQEKKMNSLQNKVKSPWHHKLR